MHPPMASPADDRHDLMHPEETHVSPAEPLEPDLLMEGTSHTTANLRKVVTTSRSNLRVAAQAAFVAHPNGRRRDRQI